MHAVVLPSTNHHHPWCWPLLLAVQRWCHVHIIIMIIVTPLL